MPRGLAGGADLQIVKERLGHASITTTEKYLNLRELHQTGEDSQVA
jgi:site-specific recombinase XerD